MKAIPLCAVAILAVSISAAERKEIILWPDGAPGETTSLEAERDTTKDSDNKVAGDRVVRLGNVSKPTITLYPAPREKANGAAVLVCPGGGYHILAMDLEGTEVCERLNAMGISAVLLKYRVPRRPNMEKHTAPLQDAQRALGIVRHRGNEWGVDPKRIGVLGFSAGGHLAAALSTHSAERTYPKVDAADEIDCRPNFSVLIYPGYLVENNTGPKVSPELTINTNTPDTFIAMSADDPVKVENALLYAVALHKEKVSLELHIYPTGGHGYGLRKTAEPVTRWPERLEEWFAARGFTRK